MPANHLVNANQAARCRHIKVNGLRCGSPARHGRSYCCFHDSALRRNREFVLPIVEDAASLQLALNKIMQALLDKLIDQKTAATLLYGLQIAFANLKQLKGEQRVDQLEHALQAAPHHPQSNIDESSTSASPAAPAPSPAPPHSDRVAHAPVAQAPSHVRSDNPTAASGPESPVEQFLHQFFSDEPKTKNEDEAGEPGTFDINACADEAVDLPIDNRKFSCRRLSAVNNTACPDPAIVAI